MVSGTGGCAGRLLLSPVIEEPGQDDGWRLADCGCGRLVLVLGVAGPAFAFAHLPAAALALALAAVRHYPFARVARALAVQLLAAAVAPGDDAAPLAAHVGLGLQLDRLVRVPADGIRLEGAIRAGQARGVVVSLE